MADPVIHLHDQGPTAHYDPETRSYTVECVCGHVTEPVYPTGGITQSGEPREAVEKALDLFYQHAAKAQAWEISRMRPVVEAVLALKHGPGITPAIIADVMLAIEDFEQPDSRSIEPVVTKAEAQRQARKQAYDILVEQGLPLPPDLRDEFRPQT